MIFLSLLFVFVMGMGVLGITFLSLIRWSSVFPQKRDEGTSKLFLLFTILAVSVFLAAMVMIFYKNPIFVKIDNIVPLVGGNTSTKWGEFLVMLFTRYKNAFVIIVFNFLIISFCSFFMLDKFLGDKEQT